MSTTKPSRSLRTLASTPRTEQGSWAEGRALRELGVGGRRHGETQSNAQG